MACDSLCVWPILSAIDRELVEKAKYFAILDDGSNAILITNDKEAYGIGVNGEHGPLGLGTPESFFYAAKIKIFSGEEIISLVGANNGHIVALTKDFQLFAWGNNKYKIIEDSSNDYIYVPQHIPIDGKVRRVAVGGRHNLAITFNHKVYAWGDNSDGQLGTGDYVSCSKPIRSGVGEMEEAVAVIDIACGLVNSYYITSENKLYSAGAGYYGALGTGSSQPSSNTVEVATDEFYKKVVAGRYTVYAITKDDNTLYGWGRNDECQLGINSTNDELTPVKIGVFQDVGAHFDCDMAAGLASGTVYVWGKTRFGKVSTPKKTPVEVLDDAFIIYITSRTFRLHAVGPDVPIIEPDIEVIIEPEEEPILEIMIHAGSFTGPFFIVSWNDLERNSYFFKSLIKSGQITKATQHYVILGFSEEVINCYVHYIRNGNLPQNVTEETLFGLYNLAIQYREMGLIHFLIVKFGMKPPLPPETLTIKNVCFVYQKALKEGRDDIRKLCINFILENLFPVIFTSNEFLYEIECNSMRRIMQDLAMYYEPLQLQLTNAQTGDGSQQVLTSYPPSLVQTSSEEIGMIMTSCGGGDIDSLVNFTTQLETKIEMEVKAVTTTPTCITLLPPRVQQYSIM